MISSHLFLAILLTAYFSGCTSKNDSITQSSVKVIIDGASPDRSLIEANKEVVLLKDRLNSDLNYQLTSDDLKLLNSEKILVTDSDLKMWVK